MTTFPHTQAQGSNKKPSFKDINAAVKSALKKMEQPQGVLPGENPPTSKTGRLLTIYQGVKPLLVVLTTIVLIPLTWRTALSIFIDALDTVAGDLAEFKAGKDL